MHLQAEARLGAHASVYAGPHLRLFSPPWGPSEPYRGYGGELGVRVFPWGRAPTGPWAMGRGVLASVHGDGQASVGGYASVLVGATWIPRAPRGRVRPVLSGGAGVQWIDYRVAW